MTATIDQPKVAPQRDRNGRYLIGGKAHTRVTTIAEAIDDRFNLEKWKIRQAVVGLTRRPDLYALAASTAPEDRDSLNRVADQAMEAAASSAGANLGTSLHSFTEQLDSGRPVLAPSPLDMDLDAYVKTVRSAGVHVVDGMLEQVVVLHDLEIAGTFDRLVRIDGRPLPFIADLKTGATLDYAWTGIAIQLACYANADELYDPVSGLCRPMPAVDRQQALVIHLPVGQASCTLHLVDIAAGWEAVQLCLGVRSWRRRRDLATPYVSTIDERAAWLTGRVANLRDNHPQALAALAASWPPGVPTLKAGGHDGTQLAAIATAVHDVEAAHGIPFGPADPADVADLRPPAVLIDELEARMAALPADLAADVTAKATATAIPNLRTRQATTVHARRVDELLDAAEVRFASRMLEVRALILDLIGGDVALVGAINEACAVEDDRWTEQQLTILRSIYSAVEAQHLYFVEVDGRMQLGHLDAEGQLVTRHGAKREALAAVKQIAETFGLPKPRSVADAAANPALIALDAVGATNQGAQAHE